MLILLDFTHNLNDSMVDSEDERQLYLLLGATLAGFLGTIGLTTLMFFVYNPQGSQPCSLNVCLIVISLLLITAFSVISVHPIAKKGSLFPSAIIGLYCSYLTYSALASEPNDYKCNSLSEHATTASGSTLALSMLATLAAVVWSAVRAGSNTALVSTASDSSSEASALAGEPLLETSGARTSAAEEGEAQRAMDEFEPVAYNYSFFHLIFALASMYIGMLMTGWGTGVEEKEMIDVGWASVWVKIGAQWVIGLVYTWSLVAPAIFPDRDFS
jgi:hypothetical protein